MALPLKEQIVLWIKLWFALVFGILKAFLPRGFLPRKSVKGEIVLITGAGSGLGRIFAIEFAKLGASLVLWDINDKGNKETAKECTALGAKVVTHVIDLSKKDQIAKRAQAVKDELGHVDILINNAGVVSGKLLLDCTDEQIERTIAVNTTSHLWTTRAFLPSMLERNHGHIVTLASVAGKVGCVRMVDYCTSKFGAVGFHEALTTELAYLKKDGVHTTVVCPYFIDTGMFDGFKVTNPVLLPALKPEHVVECAIDGILTNANTVQVPKFNYILSAGAQILPSGVLRLLSEGLGVNECMDEFKGRNGSPTRVMNGATPKKSQ